MTTLTPSQIREKKKRGEKIAVLTAYDYPTAKILDEEGVDMILVGDSLGMVLLGYDNTLPVTMEDMVYHAKAVSRGIRRSLAIADMPAGSFETPELALHNAGRFVKECGIGGVKIEGGSKIREQVRALTGAGIPVAGHLGMLPQSVGETGGFKVRGKKPEEAEKILEDAAMLDALGVFALFLECVPGALGAEVSKRVSCPTIGIGAGPGTDGQVLVLHDLLGFRGNVTPKFVRRYADLDGDIRKAVRAYRSDVMTGKFPSEAESY
jgi:3-methyl-2-oxobutanoate hydroxymethyltransferase